MTYWTSNQDDDTRIKHGALLKRCAVSAGTVRINGRLVAGRVKGERPSKTLWMTPDEGRMIEIQEGYYD
jgi:hypothetical protein